MTPFGNAMGLDGALSVVGTTIVKARAYLINGQQTDTARYVLQRSDKSLIVQSFGGAVKEIKMAFSKVLLCYQVFFSRQRRIHDCCFDTST